MVPRDADVLEFSGPRSIPPLVASKLGASDGVPSSLAASSLLELPGARGADGLCPPSHEVERDFMPDP